MGSVLPTHRTEAKPLHQPQYSGATEDTEKCLPVTMEMLNWRISSLLGLSTPAKLPVAVLHANGVSSPGRQRAAAPRDTAPSRKRAGGNPLGGGGSGARRAGQISKEPTGCPAKQP